MTTATASPSGWNAGPCAGCPASCRLRRCGGSTPSTSRRWLPRYIVFDSAEQFVPVVVQIMRAESLTEVPVIGRLLTTGVAKRSGPAVPEEVLAAQQHLGDGGNANGNGSTCRDSPRTRPTGGTPAVSESALPPLRASRRAPQPGRQRALRGLRPLLVRRTTTGPSATPRRPMTLMMTVAEREAFLAGLHVDIHERGLSHDTGGWRTTGLRRAQRDPRRSAITLQPWVIVVGALR